MILQYVAASLVSENKPLCHPASVDSIPSSANQEDHVSMGAIGARKLQSVVHNVTRVLAIEYLCAAQALEFAKGSFGWAPESPIACSANGYRRWRGIGKAPSTSKKPLA